MDESSDYQELKKTVKQLVDDVLENYNDQLELNTKIALLEKRIEKLEEDKGELDNQQLMYLVDRFNKLEEFIKKKMGSNESIYDR